MNFRQLLSWLASIPYLCLSIATLCIWDVVLKIAWLGPKKPYKWILDHGIYLLVLWLRLVGSYPKVSIPSLPTDRPLIVVSNHQSLLDVPLLMWFLRAHTPLFVAKQALGKFVPSVSHTLRNNGSALIDRHNPAQSVKLIRALGMLIKEHSWAACVFPEGTRSRNGKIRPFKVAGVKTLLEAAPNALLVPFVIDGSWRIAQHNFFPVPFGSQLNLTALPPIEPGQRSPEELVKDCELQISQALGNAR